MMKVEVGNAWDESATNPDGQKNGWFMGSSRFIKEDSLRCCDDAELKWSIHPRGFDSGVKPCVPDLGISVLIQGHFMIGFRDSKDGPWQVYSLNKQGDFVISRGGHEHFYRAMEDCVLLTVRLTRSGDRHVAT